MIEAEHAVSIASAIENVWEFVKDIENWSALIPGSQSCEKINSDDSRWTVKVGTGGMVRTVTILVHVEQWDAPNQVRFSYRLQGDPVVGGGSYRASRVSAGETEVSLKIRVEGSGPMSRLWEAMSTPLLPQLAKSFAGRLKAEIENATRAPGSQAAATSGTGGRLRAFGKRLVKWWRTLFGFGQAGKEPR